MKPVWRLSVNCSHANNDSCPTCDFDRYYARKYPNECPWADEADGIA